MIKYPRHHGYETFCLISNLSFSNSLFPSLTHSLSLSYFHSFSLSLNISILFYISLSLLLVCINFQNMCLNLSNLSICLYVCLTVCMFLFSSVCVYRSVCLSDNRSISLFVCSSVSLSVSYLLGFTWTMSRSHCTAGIAIGAHPSSVAASSMC